MFKIILSPSKTFDLTKPWKDGERPVFIAQAKEIFGEIRKLTLEQTQEAFNLSDKLATKVHQMHQTHGQVFYRAIDMYSGLVFQQLEKDKYDLEWINEHVVILDALYGVVRPLDLIAPYRLDFNNKMLSKEQRSIWEQKINEYLKDHEIINFASGEFSSLINKEMTQPEMDESIKQIKVRRGKALNNFILDKIKDK